MINQELLSTLQYQLGELKKEQEQIPKLIKALTALGHSPAKIAIAEQKIVAEITRVENAIKALK